jgi:hypothetical protein
MTIRKLFVREITRSWKHGIDRVGTKFAFDDTAVDIVSQVTLPENCTVVMSAR